MLNTAKLKEGQTSRKSSDNTNGFDFALNETINHLQMIHVVRSAVQNGDVQHERRAGLILLVLVTGGPHPWKRHNVLILSCRNSDTPSGFTQRRERTAEDSNYVVDWKPQPIQKNLESKCLYLKLSWLCLWLSTLLLYTKTHAVRRLVGSTQLQTIRITLWFCVVAPCRQSA